MARELSIETSHGPARARLTRGTGARALLVLGHGAGGGIEARDLVAAADVALARGLGVALVEQPYRVAGRRSPAPAKQLDAVWVAVVRHLAGRVLPDVPLVVGGRSLGARVACRTSGIVSAVGVLCLAFPLQPPRRATAAPAPSRLQELDDVDLPTLVVQGDRDPFGIPPESTRRAVRLVHGDHSLRADIAGVSAAVDEWLAALLAD